MKMCVTCVEIKCVSVVDVSILGIKCRGLIKMGFNEYLDFANNMQDICIYCGKITDKGTMPKYRLSSSRMIKVCNKDCAVSYIQYLIDNMRSNLSELESVLKVIRHQ